MYKAIVIGATGLVGSHLVNEIIKDSNCEKIRVIVRRKTDFKHNKVEEIIIDFNRFEDYKENIEGDVLFSCLGTTRGQAGSQEKQYLVDYTYQYRAAKIAKENGVTSYALVSSPYADIQSKNYYRKMKAELEEAIKKLDFNKTIILQPNGLMGEREKPRIYEKWLIPFFISLTKIFGSLKKFHPIEGKKVAQVLLTTYNELRMSSTNFLVLRREELDDYIKTTHNNG